MVRKRIMYFDYLRVAATISVVVLHVSAQNWYSFNGRSFEWNVFNFYDSIVRWGVPIFLMISGSLFLYRDIEIKNLYRKYILRLFVAYCFWALFYAVYSPIIDSIIGKGFALPIKSIIKNTISGNYHMWFIPMIIGTYMYIPIIKQIINNKKITEYYLILSFIFAFLVPQLVNMSCDFIGGLFHSGIVTISQVVSKMNRNLVLGYTFYFVLGYYLGNTKLNKKQKVAVYISGLLGFLSTVLLNAMVAWETQKPCQTYYNNFSINVLLEAIVVYIWFKNKNYDGRKINGLISKLSKYSFGAYLVHAFVIDMLHRAG